MTHVVMRAICAYHRREKAPYPDAEASGERVVEGRRYVVLGREDTGIIAVYRIKTDGVLKRLRRWPEAVERNT